MWSIQPSIPDHKSLHETKEFGCMCRDRHDKHHYFNQCGLDIMILLMSQLTFLKYVNIKCCQNYSVLTVLFKEKYMQGTHHLLDFCQKVGVSVQITESGVMLHITLKLKLLYLCHQYQPCLLAFLSYMRFNNKSQRWNHF